MIHKPFNSQSGYTMFDNFILDVIMPELKPTHWKVLCFIMRKTIGWHRVEDGLSYSQIMDGTGIKNRTTISGAIKELVRLGYIARLATEEQNDPNRYRINTEYEIEVEGSKKETKPEPEPEPKEDPAGSTKNVLPPENEQKGGTKNVPQVVQKSDTQKKGKENNNHRRGGGGALDGEFAQVCKVYESEIGMLTAHVSERLGDFMEEYSAGWVIDSMKIARENGAPRLKYFEAILQRWGTHGRDAPKPDRQNGTASNAPQIVKFTEEPIYK